MGWFRSAGGAGDDATPSFEDRLAQISPGVPGRCPSCDGLGYIDSIDIGHRYQIQHCKDCLHRWEYLFDEAGAVVGLTELDADGQPVTRSRVRPARTAPLVAERAAPPPEVPTPDIDLTVPDDEPDDEPAERVSDDVVDLRDPVVPGEAVVDLTEPEQLSPAEWLRQSVRR